jgi:endonuclease YncB( thermonuclease family)
LENDEKVVLIGLKPSKPVKFMEVNRDKHGFIIPDNDPTTPFDVEALRFASAMAEGKAVRLEFDAERRNADGILQAYVILPDGSLLNAELVRYGYADMRLVPPNMKYADKLRAAYQEARRELRGIQGQ